jgi:hypothetical protein
MLNRITFALILAGAEATVCRTASAQQTVAPTDSQVGSPRGDTLGTYNITQSFELGYRFVTLGGDEGMYRSVENYRNGIRLLGSRLSINSREGHGHYFDEFLLTTQGLGNDPYESAMLRIQKNRLYRYDLSWRLQNYYNPGLTVADVNYLRFPVGTTGLLTTGGAHARDTSRRMQDHDLTLLPQSAIRFRVGYSRNIEDGPALSTAQEFDVNGPAFPVFADIKRSWNEYRVGADLDLAGFRLNITRRWGFFKEDTPYSFLVPSTSVTAADLTALSNFSRTEPIHGENPGWIGNLATRRHYWAINARATYLSGARNFIENEAAFGTSQFGGAATRQILVSGDAKRPSTAGDFSISLFPTEKITVINNTSILSNRINGQSSYSEVETGFDFGTTLNFRYLGIRTVTNSTDVNYRITKVLGVYAAYRYSDRELNYTTGSDFPAVPGSAFSDSYTVSNHLNSGVLGIRIRPIKPLTINLDGEVGRANFPLTPVSEKNYHNLNGRADYRTRKLTLSTSYRQAYNINSPAVFSSFSSHSRNYTASASWAPRDSFSLDATYIKLHLDTRGSISFFASAGVRPTLQSNLPSYYVSNMHVANLSARFGIRRRADLYVGYAITKDTGGDRLFTFDPAVNPVGALLSSVQTYPLTYHSPMARLSIRITPKIRWNAGWQYYGYAEKFHLFGENQNFRAHTGFTSVLWSF